MMPREILAERQGKFLENPIERVQEDEAFSYCLDEKGIFEGMILIHMDNFYPAQSLKCVAFE